MLRKGVQISDDAEVPLVSSARMVVSRAQQEANDLGHPQVGMEHVLLALLREEGQECHQVRGLPSSVRPAAADGPPDRLFVDDRTRGQCLGFHLEQAGDSRSRSSNDLRRSLRRPGRGQGVTHVSGIPAYVLRVRRNEISLIRTSAGPGRGHRSPDDRETTHDHSRSARLRCPLHRSRHFAKCAARVLMVSSLPRSKNRRMAWDSGSAP